MVKAVLLDLDGTLINSHDAHVKAYKKILDSYKLKINTRELESKFGLIAEDILKELFPKLSSKDVHEVVLQKRKFFIENINLVKLKPCVNEFLETASKHCILAIATSISREELLAVLQKFSWTKYFKVLVTSYDVIHPKPAPDLLIKIVRELRINLSDAVFIGDSVFDALSAKSAGICFIGVATGAFSLESFKKEGFEAYSSLCEIKNVLFSK